MKTIRDLKNEFLTFNGVQTHSDLPEFKQDFFRKLNRLGWQKKTKTPEECNDIDASAFLSTEEYTSLTSEYQSL